MIKKDKTQHVLNSYNSFDKNLRFTADTFKDVNVHFLDIKTLINSETDIYIKDQYCTLCSVLQLWTLEHKNCLGTLIVW